jgi:hypothetical protein
LGKDMCVFLKISLQSNILCLGVYACVNSGIIINF